MLGKTQETSFYKLDWAQRENEMCPEAMKKVGTECQAMEAQENVGTKVGSLVLMANKKALIMGSKLGEMRTNR